jgi:hypothetical protein
MRNKFIFLMLLIGIMIPKISYAVFESDSDIDVDEFKTCPGDYYNFISKVRSEGERKEYFKDMFTKSYCQIDDIIQINDELDDVRESFRSAALTCDDTSKYKKQYVELVMELYFVRHIQEIPSDIIDEAELEEIEEKRDMILESLHDEMLLLYVTQKSQVDADTFESYFDAWSSKYEDRVEDYSNCEEGPWAELEDTINDFKETISKLSVDTEEPEEKTVEDKAVFRTDISKNIKEFYKKFVLEETSEVEAELTVDKASEKSGSILGTFSLLENDDDRFAMEIASKERLARYKLIYGEGGAKVSDNLQAVVTQLNEVIAETSATYFPEVISKAGTIYEKQCK